ncbi:MAG: reverse transcriptase domain-containing protein [Photobacterium frigidiphilum]|uniref:reverse transcriptase domain-containing protein n=1 Tax=Photobacterium frigidiphilum TaxID=264736 RepID=UPI0030015F43
MNSPVSWIEKYEVKPGRWVYIPTEESKLLGKKIIKHVNKHWQAPPYFFHLKKGGHVQALKSHLESHYFASLDIADFFGSMSRTRVTRSLKEYLGYEDARAIAKASTIPHRRKDEHSHALPYGFSQSPLLASLCLDKSTLGKCIKECYESPEAIITVYMDDIVVSSSNKTHIQKWLNKVKFAAKKSNLKLNEAKELPISAKVEVFNIELSTEALAITDKRFSLFYDVYKNSTSEPQRHGIGGYVWTVNPQQAKQLDL